MWFSHTQPVRISNETPLRPPLLDYQQHLQGNLQVTATRRRPHYPPVPRKPGSIFTFGSAVGGELGLGTGTQERRKPGQLKRWLTVADEQEPVQVVAVECGGQHTLALDAQGRVWSWGVNDQGALGRETVDSQEDEDEDDEEEVLNPKSCWRPGLVSLPSAVIQMVCADSFSAVLTMEGVVYAWGSFRDPSGVIGFSKTMKHQSQKLPMALNIPKRVVLLGSGDNHVLMVCEDDTLWAMGANDENQLGRRVSSRFKNNLEPYEIMGRRQLALRNIVKITGGAYHTLYINAQGELYTFGCNNCGQLGLGDIESHLNGPERVMKFVDGSEGPVQDLPPIVDIAAGESHSLALARDGRVFAFGANLEGQLGFKIHVDDYHFQYQSMPRLLNPASSWSEDDEHGLPPTAIDPVIMVDAQSRFSLCVTSLGKLYTWGSGHSYQLGNEEMEDEEKPFRVPLKQRKCFWARCGGQFTMFLLEPKDDTEVEYRQPAPVIAPSSLPGSPHQQQHFMHGDSSSGASTPAKQAVLAVQTDKASPTRALQASFENVCVSPDKKRPRVLDGSTNDMSMEMRMAPWSPTKHRSTHDSMMTAPSASSSSRQGSRRATIQERLKRNGL